MTKAKGFGFAVTRDRKMDLFNLGGVDVFVTCEGRLIMLDQGQRFWLCSDKPGRWICLPVASVSEPGLRGVR